MCAISMIVNVPLSNAGGMHAVEPVEQFLLHRCPPDGAQHWCHIADPRFNLTCCPAVSSFWASVKMLCDGFMSDLPVVICKGNSRSLKETQLACGSYFSLTTHWKRTVCIPLFVNHYCQSEQCFISKAKCLKLFTF